MKVTVRAKPGSRHNRLSLENGEIVIRIKASAHDGKANKELVRFLASVLDIPKSHIVISSGHLSPFKRLELPDKAAGRLRELAANAAA